MDGIVPNLRGRDIYDNSWNIVTKKVSPDEATTMLLFKGGIEVARQAGAMPAPAIRKFIEPGR